MTFKRKDVVGWGGWGARAGRGGEGGGWREGCRKGEQGCVLPEQGKKREGDQGLAGNPAPRYERKREGGVQIKKACRSVRVRKRKGEGWEERRCTNPLQSQGTGRGEPEGRV